MEESLDYTPHSLLDAVKLAASTAGMEWATAHRYYRDLQGVSRSEAEVYWLPKSMGRNIWHASPNFLARFLAAIGMTDDATMACAIVCVTWQFTPNGRERHQVEPIEYPVEHFLANLLADPTAADAVEWVEFDPVELRVDVRFRDGTSQFFAAPRSNEETHFNAVIYRRGVIPGAVFSGLSRAINWRSDAPLKVPQGEVDPEA